MITIRHLKQPAVILAKAGVQFFLAHIKVGGITPVLITFACALYIPDVYAGHADGQIIAVRSRASDGLVWINVSGSRVNKPACALHDYMMIKDENSETGKKQFAMLLQAHATGKRVVVYGTGNCSRWGDGEAIDTVEIMQ